MLVSVYLQKSLKFDISPCLQVCLLVMNPRLPSQEILTNFGWKKMTTVMLWKVLITVKVSEVIEDDLTSWFDVTETRPRMTHQHYLNDSLEGQWFEFYKRYHTEQISIPSKLLKSEARKHKMIVFYRFIFSFTFDWLCYRKFKKSVLSCLPRFQSVYTLHVLYLSKFNSVIITLIPLSSCPPSASQLVSLPYYLFIYYVNLVLVCRSALLATGQSRPANETNPEDGFEKCEICKGGH